MELYFSYQGKKWINKNLLTELFRIPSKLISNRLSDSSYTSWNCLKQDDGTYIEYGSIPNSIRTKYSLPSDFEIEEVIKAEKAVIIGKKQNARRTEYKLFLEQNVKMYAKSVPFFIQMNGGGTYQIHECAMKYSLLQMAIALIDRDGYGSKRNIIEVILNSDVISALSIPKTEKDLYKYLSNAEKAKRGNTLPQFVRHGLLGKKSNHTKINERVEKVLIFLARSGNQLKHTTITHQLNVLLILFPKLNGSKLVSRKAVNSFLNQPRIKNLVTYASDPDYILELEPEVYTHHSSYPLQRVYIDGTKLQFINKDRSGTSVTYRVIIFIIDSFSSKILGFSLSDTENTIGLMKAVRMMLETTNYVFPEEVVTDKGAVMKSKVFKKLINKVNELGITHSEDDLSQVDLIQRSNPRAKASAERFFRSFQDAYLRPHFGWVGEGIKSKNDKAHPNRIIKVALHNPDLLKDEFQLEDFIFSQVIAYNKHGFNLDVVEGPNDFFRELHNKDVGIRLPNHLVPYICFPSTSIKFANCAVRIINEKQEYIFQKIDAQIAKNLTGQNVDCYVDYDDPKEVYIYQASSPKFITSMKRLSRINESKKRRGLDAERMYREIVSGKKIIKQHLDDELKDNFNSVMEMFSQQFPHQIVSYSTEAKESIYLMEFLEEIESKQPDTDSILYNSSAVKAPKFKKSGNRKSRYSKSTF